MKSDKKKRSVTDASESNAGDDFHILWTVQKSLELINFRKDGLKAISIESLVNSDTAYVDPDGDVCLGVDLTIRAKTLSQPTAFRSI
jgi:hypothetical protein